MDLAKALGWVVFAISQGLVGAGLILIVINTRRKNNGAGKNKL